MKIHYNEEFNCYETTECQKTDSIELDGVRLIPITELKKIKVEIEKECEEMVSVKDWGRYYGLYLSFEIINNHISELKGENK